MTRRGYLIRAIVALALWIISLALSQYVMNSPEQNFMLMLVPGVVVALFLGRPILDLVTRVTGLVFFMSGVGMLFFYGGVMVLSPLILPVYAAWSFYRFATTPAG